MHRITADLHRGDDLKLASEDWSRALSVLELSGVTGEHRLAGDWACSGRQGASCEESESVVA